MDRSTSILNITLKETLSRLQELGSEKMRMQNKKSGAGDNQYGVKHGDIRTLARKIKSNHKLALSLWETQNIDARLLAILIMDPKALSLSEMEGMVLSEKYTIVADWLTSYVVKLHPDKEALREKWMFSTNTMAARAGWSLTSERIARNSDGLDIVSILVRIETEMPGASPEVQWTMNFALAHIGISFPDYRERAISIGEKLGIYRNYPVSKGCTSPFAPIWIKEMVSRQSK
jgi:3-methyladenine DNA glycosylase AlkD